MTGEEIVPAAEVVVKSAKRALGSDPQTAEALLEAAKEAPQFRAAAVSVAKQQEIKQAIKLKVLQPLGRLMGASRDYFDSDFAVDLAKKMASVPEADIQTPKPSIAMPVLEALSYSVDEENLKEMYLTLMGRASDRRASGTVHPAHSQIIRQLDADEVGLLTATLRREQHAIVQLTQKAPDGGEGHTIRRQHLMNTYLDEDRWEVPESESWIDNWVRLGLIEVNYVSSLADSRFYDWVRNRPEMHAGLPDAPALEFTKGFVRRTAFGQRFAAAAIPNTRARSAIVIKPSLILF